ncbi:hypothetical protein A7S32_22785 [Salmonella enterica subsp. diarizonae serovar 59:[k]:z35]|nr:hypothetical protein A7S32_22785 [Salmonella enterica subsp. diarizonae serovar 59:[k]:z35]
MAMSGNQRKFIVVAFEGVAAVFKDSLILQESARNFLQHRFPRCNPQHGDHLLVRDHRDYLLLAAIDNHLFERFNIVILRVFHDLPT